MGKEKMLVEQLELLAERSKNIESALLQLISINSNLLRLVEFPVKMIWTAEDGWHAKEDLERQAVENSKRLVRRLARHRPTEAEKREWLNEY